MDKKRKYMLVLAVLCCVVFASVWKLRTDAASASASVGGLATADSRVIFRSKDIDYLNNELKQLQNEINGNYSMSESVMVSADTKKRRDLLVSHGTINYGSGTVVANAADLSLLADKTDALGNAYSTAICRALNQIGTYFDADGNASHASQTAQSIVLSCGQLAEGILQSQSVSHLGAPPVTADNITAGAAAWVNGKRIIGNGADNERAYQRGLQDGAAGTGDGIEIQQAYHIHAGSSDKNPIPDGDVYYSASNPGGCYVASGHTHDAGGLDCGTIEHGNTVSVSGSYFEPNEIFGYWHFSLKCTLCFYTWEYTAPAPSDLPTECHNCFGRERRTCTNQTNTWKIGCGKSTNQLEGMVITIRKNK